MNSLENKMVFWKRIRLRDRGARTWGLDCKLFFFMPFSVLYFFFRRKQATDTNTQTQEHTEQINVTGAKRGKTLGSKTRLVLALFLIS